ncbi:homeobox-leucine zipper protein ROC2-like isoform X2 [Phoenix dactylifera]|uniref:Homeobox-leucine zipper protein ROC2-like isoform X2 n=1 Tax=Phoenix dactylifera TaxID=42345 RepID=A0A8B9A5G1_PHODC|nr:homeobox-leucine zipper protein ROC2-like isoform X2 [Phoenix dactylifera]
MEFQGRRMNMLEGQAPAPQQNTDPESFQAAMEIEVPRLVDEEDLSANPRSEVPVDASSGEDQRPRAPKRKYQRHTPDQIKELEAVFRVCPHPDDKQRKELSQKLGLRPQQVKFWFQNRRTQSKNHRERDENNKLRKENDELRRENFRMKEALNKPCCKNCGGPCAIGEMSPIDEHRLTLENACLQAEVVSGVVTGIAQVPVDTMGAESSRAAELRSSSPTVQPRAQVQRPFFESLAGLAMEELFMMARTCEPLWIRGLDGYSEILNEDEYAGAFPRGLGPKLPALKTEVTRGTALIPTTPLYLVDIIVNVSKWSTFFSGIVSSADCLEIPETSICTKGMLQLITAELQVPSPLVPPRECVFLRYCKKHAEGVWVIVDVSMNNRDNSEIRYRRRPSGCLIQEMPNGSSKITWVEHVEVDDSGVHDMYKAVVNSGLAFGAKRWLSTLERQWERLESISAINNPRFGINANPEGRHSILRLVERMVVGFCGGVSGSRAQDWSHISGVGAEDVKITAKRNPLATCEPPGILVNACMSLWLPLPPGRVFHFLRTSRNEVFRAPSIWDVLTNGGAIEEGCHIANGREEGNCISILNVRGPENPSHVMILQENCSHATGSYVIYAPIDIVALNAILTGQEADYVALLPCGFTIFPDLPHGMQDGIDGEGGSGGSLLTVSFQILADSNPHSNISADTIATLTALVTNTCDQVISSLFGNNVP